MILAWDDIKELNDRIEAKDLACKVHLSDACSGQSMWLEDLTDSGFKDLEAIHQLIKAFFAEKKVEIDFSWDKKCFWTKDRLKKS
ncbi:MAG: hypothetical protein PWP16_969 [Eubacteriaceae bacterium]|jgi:hemolysin-activating ACP:hemolysin acyltransferase|nr:hypothetical protein [Eubacteriaceae bacterium]MDK2904337.1 hypothetical protein [Eubacteriaceae bacterium]MDK2935115.1 hypothetical protein [Eubacteriaceae bacterium]MDN5307606.1 hypothetical protein [Eubacteriaceae bacterium]